MRRIPMMLQLVIIMFCVMVIPTTVLTSYSGSKFLANSEEMIAETSLAGLIANRHLFENSIANLASDAVRLSSSTIFNQIRFMETYDDINANYNNVNYGLSLLKELVNLNHRVDGVYSAFFYQFGSDYVISTDKGITRLSSYEPIDWLDEQFEASQGIVGIWYPRELNSGVTVLTYALPLSKLTTTTNGAIVVNLLESQISDYLRSSNPAEQQYFLLNADGQVVSHNDKSLLLADASDWPLVQRIMTGSQLEGYLFEELDGERMLVTWTSTPHKEWIFVKLFSMDDLMTKTNQIERNLTMMMIITLIIAAIATVLLARWLSTPVRRLVQAVRSNPKLEALQKRNELAFLDDAFKRMQEEEAALQKLLEKREQDARNLAVQRLLRGEPAESISEIFPETIFRLAVLSIDRYRDYVKKNNRETRSYNRYLFMQWCHEQFPDDMRLQVVYMGDGYFAFVMNGERLSEESIHDTLEALFLRIRDKGQELFAHTVTISISDYTENCSTIPDLLAEAMELIKLRMIKGGGCITFWREEAEGSHKYIYPANSERRILNYLDSRDLDSIYKELEEIRKEILSVEYISYDNILFIYNQLAGVTIKHLRENTNIARLFAGRSNVYSTLASFDTIEEIEEYLREFYRQIIKQLDSHQQKSNHSDRIIKYLEDHYHQDIIFEDMAKEIGISYSYMRKIVSETTGKSLIDCLNQLRIDKAKELLLDTELTISQIAEKVGYHNVQSFNRYFRKFEGMSPSNYRSLKLTPQHEI
ncbi:hypothetical protein PRECH8_13360 [Insulibacter thermoxylanivorax]|uniref:HTH araC/xylS-type domain-containing protein n=1 Tax=Insulibacter thermoxylanivorax TaxID=2749268 RepID=A0A916QCI0_9BACL|nr:AraC family transcriptional regulator [Insulibacter thermoxylanivorax]GFR38040.1 hypothetical protein PRECH8_13360 [Insulibacter thermoxylanivorax]